MTGIAFIREDRTHLEIIADGSRIATCACFLTGEIPEDEQPCYARYAEQRNYIKLLHNASLTIWPDKLFKDVFLLQDFLFDVFRMVRTGALQGVPKVKKSSRYF